MPSAFAPASDQGLQLRLLGALHAQLNGQPVSGLSYNKMRALLAYLAVEGEQDHKRETLAELLWAGQNASTARGNLRRTLADLRRVLELPSGDSLFFASKHSIRFRTNGSVDVLDFTAPPPANSAQAQSHDERVLALYRGEFLAGLSLPDCQEFGYWLQVQRESLHRRALTLLERLTVRYESQGNYPKALEFALRYCELEPWDEDACRRVMQLHAFNGHHRAALGQYEACCARLKRELGLLPSAETRLLAERIRHGALQRASLPAEQVIHAEATVTLPAQRRQVTVLYCELMLRIVLDPEEAMARLDLPQARCIAIIEQHGGHIVQTHGGGLLAYFGYPQAREDAARRAVRAALAVSREAVSDMDIRAAVHTGLIITGGDTSVPDTSGRTTRIAMQLRQHGAQHPVVISRDTHDIAGGYFVCQSQGTQTLPGVAQALEVFTVQGESGARDRLDAAARLTPLIGRQTEISRLVTWWGQAGKGLRPVVLIRGEAGIGKSRLLHTLKERLANTPHAIMELRCFPEFAQSPFHPLIAMFETAIGIASGDVPGSHLARLAQYLDRHIPDRAREGVPLIAQLLSLPHHAHDTEPAISPQMQKDQTIALVLAMLQHQAQQQPVLLVLEDLHWMDPSTLELLTRFTEQTTGGRILAVTTARPDFVPPWNHDDAKTLELGPLDANEVMELITSLRHDMPGTTMRRIVEHVDGVPLFAEELAKTASSDNEAHIPATLQDLLAVRIDDMGEAKAAAQLAATLGREFDLAVLRKVLPKGSDALADALNALQDAQLLAKRGESVCQFKHALIQQAVYESQTHAARRVAHRRIAQVLLDDFPDVVRTQPESLARHLSLGGEIHQSIDYWVKAGQRAALRCAHAEAVAHCQAGLRLLASLPSSAEHTQLECALRMGLGASLIATQGYGSIDAGSEYTRAAQLAIDPKETSIRFTAMWGMWLGSSSRVGHGHSLELAEQLLHLAQENQDALLLQKAHYAIGNSLLWTGHLSRARDHMERGMALYQPTQHAAMVRELGENICVSTGSQLAWVLWLQGLPDQALAMGEQTLALAIQVKHPYSRCYASAHLISLHRWLRQIDTTRLWAEETLSQAHQHGFPLWLLSGLAFQGWTQCMQGDSSGLAPLHSGVEAVRAAMSGIEAFFLAPLAEAHWQLGQWQESLSVVNRALSVMRAKDDHFLESEMFRLKGECLLQLAVTNLPAAEACFDQALCMSRAQGAIALELRAAMSLARLWQGQGKTDPALRLLESVHARFTQGLDTPDVVDARRLLAELVNARGPMGDNNFR